MMPASFRSSAATMGAGAGARRLSDEAQHLANLSHPNIARLLDAGSDPQHRTYLVLELVSGVRIDRYCDAHHLSLRERVRLFIEVLRAVAHAHAHLVVHRDLKPSNVMVDEAGNVKLLDFGIARLLRPGDEPEIAGATDPAAALTPEYAAPEQLLGRVVTTATDVYALGLMLYELLAGRSPRHEVPRGSFSALVDAATRDPPQASLIAVDPERTRATLPLLKRTLRGDLDNILRKALAPEVEQRYSTAQEFAADLERYLRGDVVLATPTTFTYRARKFIGRHRGSVTSALLGAMALMAALTFALVQMHEARQQRDEAQNERKRVEASNEFYGQLLEQMGSSGKPITAVELLDRGADLLRREYDADAPFMGRIHFDLSRRYGALRERNRELELLAAAESAARRDGDDDLLAAVRCSQGLAMVETDREAARPAATEGERILEAASSTSEARFLCLQLRARLSEADGDRDGAIALLARERESMLQGDEATARRRSLLLNELGRFYFHGGRYEDSLALNNDALQILADAALARTVTYMTLLNNRAAILSSCGEYREALEIQQRVLRYFEDADWVDLRAQIPRRLNYASNLIRLSRGEEAVRELEDVRRDAKDAGDGLFVGLADLWLASAYIELEQLESAARQLDIAKDSFSGNPGSWEHQIFHVKSMRGVIARKAGRVAEARAIYAELLTGLGYPPMQKTSPNLAIALDGAVRAAVAAEDYAAAEALSKDHLVNRRAMARKPERSATVGDALRFRAEALHGLGRVSEAIAELEQGVIALGNGLGADNVDTLEAQALLDRWRAGT